MLYSLCWVLRCGLRLCLLIFAFVYYWLLTRCLDACSRHAWRGPLVHSNFIELAYWASGGAHQAPAGRCRLRGTAQAFPPQGSAIESRFRMLPPRGGQGAKHYLPDGVIKLTEGGKSTPRRIEVHCCVTSDVTPDREISASRKSVQILVGGMLEPHFNQRASENNVGISQGFFTFLIPQGPTKEEISKISVFPKIYF